MMVKIPYGNETLNIDIDEEYEILLPNKVKTLNDDKIIKNALENPIEKESLKSFIEKSKDLVIIVNDATKPTPTPRIFKHIYPLLSHQSKVRFLVASGTHKKPTEKDLRFIFGSFYDIFKDKIFIHDCKNNENLKYVGKTKSGTEVYINKMVLDAGTVIVIGSIEPHYFAGYTGGRKVFIPGIAAYRTVEMNHRFALDDNACSLSLKENPIHKDFVDSIKLLDGLNIFSIQTVLTNDYKIYAASSGDIIKSFDALIDHANKVYCVKLEKKGNIVISIVPYPMDINLYQSQHALENGKFALEDNGILILVSKCRMGIGNDAFLKLLSKANTPEEVLELIGGKYKLGSHKSIRILKIKSKSELFAVTKLDDKVIRKAKFKPFSNLQDALDNAIDLIKSKDKKPKIIIIPFGNLTVPLIGR